MIYKAYIDLTLKFNTDNFYSDISDINDLKELIGDSVIDGDMDLFTDINIDVKDLKEMEI